MEREQQENTQRNSALGWFGFIVQSLATSVEVFIHKGFGERYCRNQAVAVIPLLMVYALMWSEADITGIGVFLAAYLIACMCVRADVVRRRRRGEDMPHSHYGGRPLIWRWPVLRRLREETVKGIVEPVLVFLTGALISPVSEPLGAYLMLAAVGLLTSVGLAREYQRMRALNIRDALIEQRQIAERVRNGDGR